MLRAAPRREAALNPKPYPKSERFGGDPKSEGGRASPSARLRARAREVPHEKFLTRYFLESNFFRLNGTRKYSVPYEAETDASAAPRGTWGGLRHDARTVNV